MSVSKTRILALLSATIVLGVAVLIAACGGGDAGEDTSSSATLAASGGAESPVETPAGIPGGPEECSVSDQEIGLVSKLDFEKDGEFSAGGQFPQGDTIRARMRLINCATNDTTLYFDTTQRYEMTIQPEDGGPTVWSSSDGKKFEDQAATEVIPPGETVVYFEEWDQTDGAGEQVPAGVYKVSFLSVGCGREEDEKCTFGPGGRIEIQLQES